MKTTLLISILLLYHMRLFSQTGDDGWNHRNLLAFDKNVEAARKSLTFSPGFNTQGKIHFQALINPDLPYKGGMIYHDGDFNLNYLISYKPKGHHSGTENEPEHHIPDYSGWHEQIVYYDGLGKPVQVTDVRSTPYEADLITPIRYDDLFRKNHDYLPYPLKQSGENGPGGFRSQGVAEQIEFNNYFFQDEGDYARKSLTYDQSPLHVVEKEYPPGKVWNLGSGNPIAFMRSTNTTEEVFQLKVKPDQSLEVTGYYEPGKLKKVTTFDENEHAVNDYYNLQGNKILSERSNGDTKVRTYFVYDVKNRLSYVISPAAAVYLISNTIYSPDTDWIKNLCYHYEYDTKHRLKSKKLPGSESIYIVYNQKNLPVLTQDGNQRNVHQWSFIKYDVFNRQVISGIYQHSEPVLQEMMQALVNSASRPFEEYLHASNESHGYSNLSFPNISENTEVLTVKYYDDYEALALLEDSSRLLFRDSEIPFLYPAIPMCKGKITVEKTKIIEQTGFTAPRLWTNTVYYYDKQGNILQRIQNHHFLENYLITSSTYNSSGELVTRAETLNTSYDTISIIYNTHYNISGRILMQTSAIIGQEEVVMVKNTFNELGKLKQKQIHSNNGSDFIQDKDIRHNIRDWIECINDVDTPGNDFFSEKIDYVSGSSPVFNGNISSLKWRSAKFNELNEYQFEYDEMNRLSSAVHTGQGQYHEIPANYDLNGNILSLVRTTGESQIIDNLIYTYVGNKIKSIHDQTGTVFQNNGFRDNGAFEDIEYFYDLNGNLKKDLNKQIESIDYNHLNMPQRLEIIDENHRLIENIYDGSGKKVRKQIRTNFRPESAVDYLGNFVFENGIFQYCLTEEGRILKKDSVYEYQYFFKDHLGNVRLVYDEHGNIWQDNSYYPFGMQIDNLSFSVDNIFQNNYLFNSKELNQDFDLNWYDYGARFYDPVIGKWHVQDPLAENFYDISPYTYVTNNPVNAIDPDGRYLLFISGLRLFHAKADQLSQLGGYKIHRQDVYNYWSTPKNTFGKAVDLVSFYKQLYRDENVGFTSGSSYWNSTGAIRSKEGELKAELFHKMVISGEITLEKGETIKIISHSQGGAHAAGFAKKLSSYLDSEGNPLYKIQVSEYITPHQPEQFSHPDNIPGFQYSHPGDKISSDAPDWLPNGGSRYQAIKGIDKFFGGDIMGGIGQPPCQGPLGNRCGHFATDNLDFIINAKQKNK